MSWSLEHRDEGWHVLAEDGSSKGCFDARTDAIKHQRSLYATEARVASMYADLDSQPELEPEPAVTLKIDALTAAVMERIAERQSLTDQALVAALEAIGTRESVVNVHPVVEPTPVTVEAPHVTVEAPNVTIAADDVSSVMFQKVKLDLGGDGASQPVVSALPITFPLENKSAFGTLEADPLTPVVQLDFVYGINTQTGLATVANSATVDTDAGRLRLQCGTNAAGSAIFNSRRIAKYRPGQGMVARFTAVFGTGVANNTQIVGVGSNADGYFFGYNGTSFGIMRRRSGAADNWIPQASWNGDTADGNGASGFNWNKQFGNVMMIKYPFLGYGDIHFWVLDSSNGWVLCHTIRYPNTTAAVQLSNPNLFFYAQNLNSGNTTNKIMYVGSVGIFISGTRSYASSPRWSYDNSKTGVTAETNIFSLRNATTYNGVPNRSLIRLRSISAGIDVANKYGVIRLRIGATLGGSPSFATINGTTADSGVTITNGNSVASVDVAGTTSAAGTLIHGISMATPGNQSVDLSSYDLFVAPGETLTVGGFATGAATIGASINWSEDI